MEAAIFCSHISDSLYLTATEEAKGDLPGSDDYTVQLRLKREDEGYSNRNIRLHR